MARALGIATWLVLAGLARAQLPGDPQPSLAECVELFLGGRCNQTARQVMASSGSPLLRPLPFWRAPELLRGPPETVAAWALWKDMGSYDLCTSDARSHHCTVQAFGGPSLGVCLPARCSIGDFLKRYRCEELLLFESANATAALLPALRNATAALQALSKALEYLAVKSRSFCAEDAEYALTPGAAAIAAVTAALGGLVALSTLAARVLRPRCGAPLAWASHFDAVGNCRRLLATRPAGGELDFLDGIRCFSTFYVQLGHTVLIAALGAKNAVPAVSAFLRSFELTAVLGAFSAVDTFFWLSGLLTALALLPRARARPSGAGALGAWGLALLHRYARLTPLYAYVLFSYTHALPLLGSGPLWPQAAHVGGSCERMWWANLLYVNNVVGEGGAVGTAGCMGWSWYLANGARRGEPSARRVIARAPLAERAPTRLSAAAPSPSLPHADMQFFAAAALAFPWYGAFPRLVRAFFAAAVGLSIAATGALSRAHAADITTLDGANGEYLYNEPYTRCGSYAVGCLFGIWLFEAGKARQAAGGAARGAASGRQRSFAAWRREPATWLHVCAWLASACLLLAVLLLPWSNLSDGGLLLKKAQRWPQWAKDTFNATQRQLWAVGLSGVAAWLLSGRGSLLRAFLSAKVWQVLAKLSYGA